MADEKVKAEIIEFLKLTEPDYENAVALIIKYGNNQTEVRVYSISPKRYYQQMRWHLAKLVGISISDFQKGIFEEEPKQLSYPPVITRIKETLPVLFNRRADLQKQLVELGDGNDDETKAKAVALGNEIDELSVRYQLLFEAKELYFEEKIMPVEAELFKDEDSDEDDPTTGRDEKDPFGIEGKDPIELMKRKSNLESSLAKDRNLLKYQSKTAQEQENPMPEGAEKEKVVARIALKEQELEAINAFLKAKEDAGKSA